MRKGPYNHIQRIIQHNIKYPTFKITLHKKYHKHQKPVPKPASRKPNLKQKKR